MHQNPVKLLILAQNASAKFGGEAFLPLKYFQILKKRDYPVKLVAHSRNREELETLLSLYQDDIYYIEDSIYHRTIWRFGSMFPKVIGDSIFGNILGIINELFQRKIVKRLVKNGEVNVVHQPIPVSPLAPSTTFGFGVPVVIGPMNGGMKYPPGYSEYQSKLSTFTVSIFRKIALLANMVLPGKRRAALLLVANDRTLAALPFRPRNVRHIVENGVDASIWAPAVPKPGANNEASGFHLVFIGRLVDWKALEITFSAIQVARSRNVDVMLHIIGDGPERSHLEKIIQSMELENYVTFYGFRDQVECARLLQDFDALILNSLFECGGAVVLEAMSLGLPAIVSDWGGPADYVDSTCGILVSPVPKQGFDQRLADAIEKLAKNPDLCSQMGRAGADKVKAEYDWDKKVDQLVKIYNELLDDL